MKRLYDLYGLRLRTEIPLPAPVAEEATLGETSDVVEVELLPPREIEDVSADGVLLSEYRDEHGRGAAHVRTSNGYLLRYFRLCEFRVSPDLRRIEAWPDHRADPAYLPIILYSGALAFILAQRGHTVLHGSAVECIGSALALLGSSGQGKSTIADLLCRQGARLVTDDVLCLEVRKNRCWCSRGPETLRLRRQPEDAVLELSPDGRALARPPHTLLRSVPLGALVIPNPNPLANRLTLRRLAGGEAFRHLASYPRTLGWRDPEVLRRDTACFALLTRTIPVYHADIPWGPPDRAELAGSLLTLLESEPISSMDHGAP